MFARVQVCAAERDRGLSVAGPAGDPAESGQGALGPVLVPVGQAYEDYRNHPLFTDRMEGFLSALFGHDIRYTYPRLRHTKAETVAAFTAACPDETNWAQTR